MVQHTNFQQGQKVVVHLNDGSIFEDKFFEKRSRCVVLVARGRLPTNKIRSITIRRGPICKRRMV